MNLPKHEQFNIEVSFTICDGLDAVVKEEIKSLINHIKTNSLNHAFDLKVTVTHNPLIETNTEPTPMEHTPNE